MYPAWKHLTGFISLFCARWVTTDPVTFLKTAERKTVDKAAEEWLGKAQPATRLGGPSVAEGVSTASPGRRDSGQEEELFSVASVTMATFPFVSPNPELLPHLATGIQVRPRH